MQSFSLRKEIKIVNVVTTSDLFQKINLQSFNNYEFLYTNLDLYRCGYVKNKTMIGKVTVFGSGKLISIGTKSPYQSLRELKIAVNILRKYKLAKPHKINSKIRNLVARVDFKKIIPIEKLARTLPRSQYEPEQFPGLIHWFPKSATTLIFASGKVIITGATTYNEINSVYFELNKIFSS